MRSLMVLQAATLALLLLVQQSSAELVVYRNTGFGGETETCGYGCPENKECPFGHKLDNQQRSVRAVDGNRVYHVWDVKGVCRCIDSGGYRDIRNWDTLSRCKQVAWGMCIHGGC